MPRIQTFGHVVNELSAKKLSSETTLKTRGKPDRRVNIAKYLEEDMAGWDHLVVSVWDPNGLRCEPVRRVVVNYRNDLDGTNVQVLECHRAALELFEAEKFGTHDLPGVRVQ